MSGDSVGLTHWEAAQVTERQVIGMAQVGIVMGSDSDMPVMAKAADILEELGISYEMKIISAHREPDVFFEYAKTAEEKGFKVIIAGAGMAAHLPGMCAAIFPMPVIGIPMHTTSTMSCGTFPPFMPRRIQPSAAASRKNSARALHTTATNADGYMTHWKMPEPRCTAFTMSSKAKY